MRSPLWRNLSITAKAVFPVLDRLFCKKAYWQGKDKFDPNVEVPVSVADCLKLGIPLAWRTLRRVLLELDKAGFIEFIPPEQKGKKTCFRASDRWQDMQPVHTPDAGREMHSQRVQPVHTRSPLRSVIGGDLEKKKQALDQSTTSGVRELDNQHSRWQKTLDQALPVTSRELAGHITDLLGDSSIVDDSKIIKQIERLGIDQAVRFCMEIAGSVPIREPADFYRPFLAVTGKGSNREPTETPESRIGMEQEPSELTVRSFLDHEMS